MADLKNEVLAAATASKAASVTLRQLDREIKDKALLAISQELIKNITDIVAANKIDVDAAIAKQTDPAIVDRLTLNENRITEIANAVKDVIKLDDPIGEVIRKFTLPNGLDVQQIRVPLGVVAMIYEARPNVTVDAAVLILKTGSAALLRGSASAFNTNTVLTQIMRNAISSVGLPKDAIVLVPGTDHESVKHLMTARGLVDVIIPRGGAGLIESVVTGSTVPVIETGIGNCHLYVDEFADLDKALNIAINAKTQRVSVCNALETILVHKNVADAFLPKLMKSFQEKGVTVHGTSDFEKFAETCGTNFAPVTDADWASEYYSLDIAAGVVNSFDEAIAHIQKWSTGHTESIITENQANADKFVSAIDSAAVMVNASTRFTDGGEFGFGAEIGISTQKLHARGPMGLAEITSFKYVVSGSGQIRD
ncbi:MAG: glutamate-5-semialdehyde dehydrogenase [Actinobacteria bacterium]|nr:glutamate-5-semialdehyde dehydrogenase [Actinomycetota bacterium]